MQEILITRLANELEKSVADNLDQTMMRIKHRKAHTCTIKEGSQVSRVAELESENAELQAKLDAAYAKLGMVARAMYEN